MSDEHGDRMKAYEAAQDVRLDARKPIYARIDGRSFSRFTKGMKRPFDAEMTAAMVATAAGLVERTHARIGYTQSDEISLVFLADSPESSVLFDGRVLKLASVLAGLATALFTKHIAGRKYFAPWSDRLPHFDCRVCQLPDKTEAANMFVWRYKDARKNAIQSAAQAVFSSKDLHGKHGGEMIEMLSGRGITFDDYPDMFRSGTFVRRVSVERILTESEMATIPEKHRPTGPVMRTEIEKSHPDFLAMEDREGFIFSTAT